MLSIILVNYNSSADIGRCIASLKRFEPESALYEIIIVDNASTDGGADELGKKYDFVRILPSETNGGFAYGCNKGIAAARGDTVMLLNPDTRIDDNAVEKLYARLKNDDALSFIGPQLLSCDRQNQSSIQPKGILTPWRAVCESLFLQNIFPWSKLFNSYKRIGMDYANEAYVEQLSGAALMFRKDVVEKLGLFDEKYFMYFEDTDYCARAVRHGMKLLYFPESKVVHACGLLSRDAGAARARYYIESLRYFLVKNYGGLQVRFTLFVFSIGIALRAAISGATGSPKLGYYLDCLKYLTRPQKRDIPADKTARRCDTRFKKYRDLDYFRAVRRLAQSGWLPVFIRRLILARAEGYYRRKSRQSVRLEKGDTAPGHSVRGGVKRKKPGILFYHITGMSYGGTEKSLQVLAKNLDPDRYEAFFMYAAKNPYAKLYDAGEDLDSRKSYFGNSAVRLIPFDYGTREERHPHFTSRMRPSIFDVIRERDIGLLVTASEGWAHFPFNIVSEIPILLINVFGGLSLQKNIVRNICIADRIARMVRPIVPEERVRLMHNPTEEPPMDSAAAGRALRKSLGLTDEEILFGRIGRPDDRIFDPIGIRAFQKVVRKKPWAHYLVMAPMPLLKEMVSREKIENVHFLEPSGREEDVWAFHNAIDVMAHFRYDGEICSCAIAESMMCGKPIVSHRSRVANGHLETLDDSFSRVAGIDDAERYAEYLDFFADDRDRKQIRSMGAAARQKAESLFSVKNIIPRFERWIDEAL